MEQGRSSHDDESHDDDESSPSPSGAERQRTRLIELRNYADYVAPQEAHNARRGERETNLTTEFTHNGLDYRFVFDPRTDDPNEGAILTFVGRGGERLSPHEYAEPEAWDIARVKLNLPPRSNN